MLRIVFSVLALVILIAGAIIIDKGITSACEQGAYDQIDIALDRLVSPAEREFSAQLGVEIPRSNIASEACPQLKIQRVH